jgi:hypothetical protein
MFILTFWIDGVAQPVAMRYVDRDKALAVLQQFRETPAGTSVDLQDDFEARVTLPRSRTLLPVYTDLAKDIEAQIEIQVVQQRANASLQTRLQSDEVLKLHGNMAGQRGGSGLVRAQ